ncbi:MAG: bacteriocin fulvocin C-related protein [Bacteroidetes bacterium]|nr:bacteriocin fulvocin C-related protein [Bacteroidota bacterium]
MKSSATYIWLLVLLASFAFGINCSKEEVRNPSPVAASTTNPSNQRDPIDGHDERMTLITYNSTEQRAIFNSKSAEVKAAIWMDKLNSVLLNVPLTTSQRQHLVNIRNQINPLIWEENSSVSLSFQNSFYGPWLANALLHFTEEDLAKIVNTPEDYYQAGGPVNPTNGSDCECSTASDWCPVNMYCRNTNCSAYMFGCGSMWAFRCRGMCQF